MAGRRIGCPHERTAGRRRRTHRHRSPDRRLGGPRAARVRAGRDLPPRAPADRTQGTGPHPARPADRPHGQDRPAHRHARDPAAGGHHQGQRARARDRGDLLPRRRPAVGRDPDRELPRSDVADRADHAALGARPAFARRAARRARPGQRDPPGHHRQAHGAVGHQDLRRRGQGRRAADHDAARDGPAGRGRARAARQDHRRPGRVRGRRAAQHGRRPHRREPDRAPVALPADAARDLVVEQRDDDPADPDRHPAPVAGGGQGDHRGTRRRPPPPPPAPAPGPPPPAVG